MPVRPGGPWVMPMRPCGLECGIAVQMHFIVRSISSYSCRFPVAHQHTIKTPSFALAVATLLYYSGNVTLCPARYRWSVIVVRWTSDATPPELRLAKLTNESQCHGFISLAECLVGKLLAHLSSVSAHTCDAQPGCYGMRQHSSARRDITAITCRFSAHL